MQSIRENIHFFLTTHVEPNIENYKKLTKRIALIFLIALFLEIFVFNFNYFASLANEEIDLTNKISLEKSNIEDDGQNTFRLTGDNNVVEFADLNIPINSLYFKVADWQNAQTFNLKMQFSDDAHLSYFDTTEYTAGIPEKTISTVDTRSQYFRVNATGNVKNLRLEIKNDGNHEVKYPIYLTSITANPHRTFDFSLLRFVIVLGIFLIIFAFRPKSAIYKRSIVRDGTFCKGCICLTCALEVFLAITFLLYGSNLVGVATSEYNFGDWDGKSIVNTYDVGGENAQQYAKLARSFASGKLFLEDEPPDWLKNMDSPYDKSKREEAQKSTGEDYLFDVAYFNGKYYVYFGVVPVILFYLPFFLITGANFPTAIGVLISIIMFILGVSALLHRFAKYHFQHVNLGIFIILQVVIVACSGLLYLLKFPTFYSLPIACGLALSVWGLYFWMRGRTQKRRCANFIIGSFCMALVFGCRPQLALLSILALPLFWREYITNKRICTNAGIKEFACLVLPYVFVGICLCAYNYARFGSFFDFGANYNLTVNDMTKRGMNVGRIAPAFFMYFLQTPALSGVFPFIQQTAFDTTYLGQTIREATFGGIFACLPILWFLLLVRPAILMRNAKRKTHTITGIIATLLIGGVAIAILDAQMAGILQRYFADFSFMFLAATVLLIFILNENYPLDSVFNDKQQTSEKFSISKVGVARLLNKAIIVCATLSVLYSILLCFVPETGWYSDTYPFWYSSLVSLFQFWT